MIFVSVGYVVCFFVFFKQKTAYEMRISDWRSDVCSSDLQAGTVGAVDVGGADGAGLFVAETQRGDQAVDDRRHDVDVEKAGRGDKCEQGKIGRASCRERVRQYV